MIRQAEREPEMDRRVLLRSEWRLEAREVVAHFPLGRRESVGGFLTTPFRSPDSRS